jgi:hypothetical protein
MNPVTRGLLQQIGDQKLETFAQEWDALEALVIEINRQNSLSFAQQEEFFDIQARLRESYKKIQNEVEPFWRAAKIKGELLTADPFFKLIEAQSAQEFLGNWPVMQTLPAAREAFNQMLMARIAEKAKAQPGS